MINYLDEKIFGTDNRIDLSKETNVTKCSNSKKCIVCHYSYFHHGFKYKIFTCNGCQDLMVLCQNPIHY